MTRWEGVVLLDGAAVRALEVDRPSVGAWALDEAGWRLLDGAERVLVYEAALRDLMKIGGAS